MPSGLLCVKRVDWQRHNADRGLPLPRDPIAPLTWAVLFKQYSGIDGEAWPECNMRVDDFRPAGLVALDHLARVRECFESIQRSCRCDLLFCEEDPVSGNYQTVPTGFEVVGFDVGISISTDTLNPYSSIYHECLLGSCRLRVHYAALLNKNLLFGDLSTAEMFARSREQALMSGESGLEDSDQMTIMRISRYRKQQERTSLHMKCFTHSETNRPSE